ncbi:hypothetical protein DR62_05990 [Burkholderia thailandensis]|nr:hypothetical protein DR62_05990 [Burkholderia thailandensis]AOI50687.1 hypothetical protein WI24_02000 [Burkholderia thailandensis]
MKSLHRSSIWMVLSTGVLAFVELVIFLGIFDRKSRRLFWQRQVLRRLCRMNIFEILVWAMTILRLFVLCFRIFYLSLNISLGTKHRGKAICFTRGCNLCFYHLMNRLTRLFNCRATFSIEHFS